ncbi:MAG TPA: hypothetical protein VFX12_13520 [Vicinamibacterales bacterium]|nr:hypothetical protein [Vicinamibacterales bacterium]
MTRLRVAIPVLLAAALSWVVFAQAPQQPAPQQPQTQAPPSQQPTELFLTINGTGGLPPKIAIAGFLPLSTDAETTAAAKTIGSVLFDDLTFEREYYVIAKDAAATVPKPSSIDDVPLDRWRELNANGVVVGTVQKTAAGAVVRVTLIDVATGHVAFGKEYSGSMANPRLYAHTISDELHALRTVIGVARTKLAFASDRDGERMKGPVGARDIKEIYISDYDGYNQQRVTVSRGLNVSPEWSPDRRAIAYTSYRRGQFSVYQDVVVSYLFEGRLTTPAHGDPTRQNYLPAWSPDGTRIAFTSNRDGNPEIYVMNKDGSGLHRLTNSPAIDVSPTWSPAGAQIAFTSDRTGSPQIYVMNADGTGLQKITSESYCDRPTWSPAPYNQIAYASRAGGGYVIKVFDVATRESKQISDSIGSNESPAFAPNGRHLAFTSTRSGKTQIFVMDRDGNNLRQITRDGNNTYPNWR